MENLLVTCCGILPALFLYASLSTSILISLGEASDPVTIQGCEWDPRLATRKALPPAC